MISRPIATHGQEHRDVPIRHQLHLLTLASLDAFNRRDLDGVMSYFTDDAVYEELTGRVNHGREAIRKAFAPQFEGKFGPDQFKDDTLH